MAKMSGKYEDRWFESGGILDLALDLDADEREQLLDKECGDDHEMRRKVLRYLEAADSPSPLDQGLEHRVGDFVASALGSRSRTVLVPGDEIGPYCIDRVIGSGGMGTVFLAHRADGHFERQVALKVLNRGVEDRDSIRRFARERRIQAGLRHTHITHLLDGGITESGIPYLVLDYVQGEAITEFCRRYALTIDERLRLFLQVCSAVGYAHREGVIHRDLKPTNILVEQDSEGKASVSVLDFGIALHPQQMDLTLTGQVIGTPGYMAPEQAVGDHGNIDRRCDIYSLGIILYELLCGRKPFESSGIRDYLFPSLDEGHTSVNRLDPNVPSDLAMITLTCLEIEPARRYDSARALAEDIERYLDGRPISVRPVGIIGRANRWARRHKLTASLLAFGIAATVISGCLLIAGAVKYTRDLDFERVQAVAARDDVEELLDFMLEDLRAGLQPIGRLDLLEQVARKSQEHYDGLPQGAVHGASLHRHGLAYINVGLVLEAQGHLPEALAAYEKSRDVAMVLVESDKNPMWRMDLARALQAVAEVLDQQGHYEQTLETLARALQETAFLAGRFPDEVPWQRVHFKILTHMGWTLREVGRFADAGEQLKLALQLAGTQLAGKDLNSEDGLYWRHQIAVVRSYLGLVLQQKGEINEAIDQYSTALNACRNLVKTDPDNTGWLMELQLVYSRIGGAQEQADKPEEALASLEKGLVIGQKLVGLEPANSRWLRELNVSFSTIGTVRRNLGDFEGARRDLENALHISSQLAENTPEDSWAQNDYAYDLLELGRVERALQHQTTARKYFESAVLVMASVNDSISDSGSQAYFLDAHAQTLLELGRRDEALVLVKILKENGWFEGDIVELCKRNDIDLNSRD